jgi:outer membrane lipoprotein-sorting protein
MQQNGCVTNLGVFLLIVLLFVTGGCIEALRGPAPVCPGKSSVTEALSAVSDLSAGLIPLKGYGQCRLGFITDKGRTQEFNFPVKLWLFPPSEIRLQCHATFQGNIDLGSNDKEFWLAVRPEVSTYAWGRWEEFEEMEGLDTTALSPQRVLEALGMMKTDEEHPWSLSSEKGVDILGLRDAQGRLKQRILCETCHYHIKHIEYFDKQGDVSMTVDLDDYKTVVKGCEVPSRLRIRRFAQGALTDWVKITLDTIEPKDYSARLRQRVFERPGFQGYDHVVELTAPRP